ncbi:AbrB/MazE/SpoVT family DNA-binding domain-containing protein [candidate division CSSED10-310 bacterium]|uniref:AbrB/MazE/SpoVT family DNA-binding domain-containing protein n=1 Tax=candidate division CSSED10-310 bacterium TaxID=2855610 RepID=A0ABV6Z5U0_UNCC1
MKTQVQKWGNSLALRIPKAFASEAKLSQNSYVELSLVDGKLVVTPITPLSITLEGLLAQVTTENIHAEIDTGVSAGKEIW